MDVRSLVLNAQAGDTAAFDQLITFLMDNIRRMVVSMYRFRGWDFIETVIADTISRAWEKLAGYDPDKGCFMTWLRQQARHVAGNETGFWHFDSELSLAALKDAGIEPSTEGPAERHEVSAWRRAIWEVVRSLPRDLRFPFILHACRGYSVPRIARRLGIGEEAVRYRLRQACQLLKRRLRDLVARPTGGMDWVQEDPEQDDEQRVA